MKQNLHSESVREDALLRQSNTVFPDTVLNEARGYRYFLSAPMMTKVQRVGGILVGAVNCLLGIGLVVCSIVAPRMIAEMVNSGWFGIAIIPLMLAFSVLGIVFAVFGFRMVVRAVK